jgi:hypothetical protein
VGIVATADPLGAAILVVVAYGLPVVAVVLAALRLRGGMRIFWMALITAGALFIPLIGIIIAVGFLIFKGRFVDWQRSTFRPKVKPKHKA